MKLVTFLGHQPSTPSLGACSAVDATIVDLQAVHRRIAGREHLALRSMQDLIESGADGLELASHCLAEAELREQMPASEVKLLAPIPRPIQVRDCLCFEGHLLGCMEAATALTGEPPSEGLSSMLEVFRQRPIYYKANRFAVVGPEVEVIWPVYSTLMDYELELGMVLGRTGNNIPIESAADYIFGYTIFNDLSARDTQMEEMGGGLGPGKSKDFNGANIMGPCIVTADEFDPANAQMTVRINNELVSEGNSGSMKYSFEELIAYISREETLYAGEIFGSGTISGGCGFETGRLLQSGDRVELEVSGIGVLRNRILAADTAR